MCARPGHLLSRQELEGQILGDSKKIKIRETWVEKGVLSCELRSQPQGVDYEARAKGGSWGARTLFATFFWPRAGALAGGGEQVPGGGKDRMRPGLPQRRRCAKGIVVRGGSTVLCGAGLGGVSWSSQSQQCS